MMHRRGKVLEAPTCNSLVRAAECNPGWCSYSLAHCLLPGTQCTHAIMVLMIPMVTFGTNSY